MKVTNNLVVLVLSGWIAVVPAFHGTTTTKVRRRPLSPLYFHESFVDYNPLSADTFHEVQLNGCQIAKDEDSLTTIVTQWNDANHSIVIEAKPLEYKEGDSNLFGHLVRRSRKDDSDDETSSSLPGIMLVHTEAGPLDSYLFYKADCLLQQFNAVVFICDLFSDPYGWGWSDDRSNFNDVCTSLVAEDGKLLQDRLLASTTAFCDTVSEVDPQRLAAVSWGLRGRPLKELGNIIPSEDQFQVKALAAYQQTNVHGGDDFHITSTTEDTDDTPPSTGKTPNGGTFLNYGKNEDNEESWKSVLQLIEKELF